MIFWMLADVACAVDMGRCIVFFETYDDYVITLITVVIGPSI